MSLFIANLAFADQPKLLEAAKIGILGGSLIAGGAGFLIPVLSAPRENRFNLALPEKVTVQGATVSLRMPYVTG